MSDTMRDEYPRPQFKRDLWLNLNGEWEFEFDDEKVGENKKWYLGDKIFSKKIQVPFCFQSKLSGICDKDFHDTVWYKRSFELMEKFKDKRIILHIGASDYKSSIWVNGKFAERHEGGHTPIQVDITNFLIDGYNTLAVKAQDYSKDFDLPKGKQSCLKESKSIFYTRTTGIWQTVWLEVVGDTCLDKIKMTPDIDTNTIGIRTFINGNEKENNLSLRVRILFDGEEVIEDEFSINNQVEERLVKLHDFNDHREGRWWTPEKPNLYDVEFELLCEGEVLDKVVSYFGMRKVSVEKGYFNLNNRPYFQKLVLDQGYFPDGILTAPSDDDIKRDIEFTKALGFNGTRKHQKVEDPRYLYWCDKLGLLVWGEMANANDYSEEYVKRFTKEWQEVIERDYNHPCIVVWVPINESWGVPNIQIEKCQQYHSLTMYYLTKSLDATRLVLSNDGWEHTKSDLITIHDYEPKAEILEKSYSTIENITNKLFGDRHLYADVYKYEGEPILVTEFGGIAYKKDKVEGWGYSEAKDDADFLNRLKAVVNPLLSSPLVKGFCYTQLTDIEQEINGLLTYDRNPKVDIIKIKEIIDGTE